MAKSHPVATTAWKGHGTLFPSGVTAILCHSNQDSLSSVPFLSELTAIQCFKAQPPLIMAKCSHWINSLVSWFLGIFSIVMLKNISELSQQL